MQIILPVYPVIHLACRVGTLEMSMDKKLAFS